MTYDKFFADFLFQAGQMEDANHGERDFLQVPSFTTPMNVELNEDPWRPMTPKRRYSDTGGLIFWR